jgi:hypothetical protein
MVAFSTQTPAVISKQITDNLKNDEIIDHPMLKDFSRIGAMLSSLDQGLIYLKRLNKSLVLYAKQTGVFDEMTVKGGAFGLGERNKLAIPTNLNGAPASRKADVGANLMDQRSLQVTRHKQFKVISGFLGNYEAKLGFNVGLQLEQSALVTTPKSGKAATLLGFVDRADFRRLLLAKARHFKDPGVPVLHGEFTHQIQWYMVAEFMRDQADFSFAPKELFKACSEPIWCRGKNLASEMSVWDLLFEGSAPSDDFRKPEATTEFLLRATSPKSEYHNELWFLADLTMGRYAKRVYEKGLRDEAERLQRMNQN